MNQINSLVGILFRQYGLNAPGLEEERDAFIGLRTQIGDLNKNMIHFWGGYHGAPGIPSMRATLEASHDCIGKESFEYLKDLAGGNDLTEAARRVGHLRDVLKNVAKQFSDVINGYWYNGQLRDIDLNQIPYHKRSCCELFLRVFGIQSRESLLHGRIVNALNPVNKELAEVKKKMHLI